VEHFDLEDQVHVRVGTLSKSLGCHGGFVSGSRRLIEWLVNRARTYIFSTASPAANSAAAIAALEIVEAEPWRREKVLSTADELRQRLREQSWNIGSSQSQIVPIFVGESEAALRLSGSLRDRGLCVPAIRPPTVPPGAACLRISLSALHTVEMIDSLVKALGEARK
jgi:7-keto-8-aminopelargonate synthetase-like enzyme